MGCRGKGVSEKLGWAWEEREWENAKSAILNKHVRSKLLNCGGGGCCGCGCVHVCARMCACGGRYLHTCEGVHVSVYVFICMCKMS